MKVDLSVVISVMISIISLGAAIFFGVLSWKRGAKQDDKKEASQMTTVIVKLEQIAKDTNEIKEDVKGVKEKVDEHTEQIIRMDESLKSVWKRIDALEGIKDDKRE